jgi:hypothetical protein
VPSNRQGISGKQAKIIKMINRLSHLDRLDGGLSGIAGKFHGSFLALLLPVDHFGGHQKIKKEI